MSAAETLAEVLRGYRAFHRNESLHANPTPMAAWLDEHGDHLLAILRLAGTAACCQHADDHGNCEMDALLDSLAALGDHVAATVCAEFVPRSPGSSWCGTCGWTMPYHRDEARS